MGTVQLLALHHAWAKCSKTITIGNCSATGCESFLKQLNCHVSTSQHCVNIVTVLRCSKLSTIHSGYHCSSDPVQVQSLNYHEASFARSIHALPAFGAASLVLGVWFTLLFFCTSVIWAAQLSSCQCKLHRYNRNILRCCSLGRFKDKS